MLARDEAAQPSSPPPAQAPAPSEPASSPELALAPAPTPAQEMKQAVIAYKAGELEDAVTRLQRLRATVSLTPQQRMAVQDSVAAVMTEIYGMAARGDARAIAAAKQYEAMQTNRQ